MLLFLVLIVLVICTILLVESGRSLGSFLLTLGLCFLIIWKFSIPFLLILKTHPILILFYLIGYVFTGVLWAVTKWYFFLRKNARLFAEWKIKCPEVTAYPTLAYAHDFEYNPQVSHHKSDLIFWMSYWPFSLLGFFINDLVRKLFQYIYDELSGFLQRMSDRAFGVKGKG